MTTARVGDLHLELAIAHEGGVSQVGGGLRPRDAVVATALGDRVDAVEDPVADVAPADSVQGCVDAVAGRLPDRRGHVRGVDEHLGRDATDVEARAAEDAALDDGDLLVPEVGGHQGVARTGSDDDEVVVSHGVRLRSGPAADAPDEAGNPVSAAEPARPADRRRPRRRSWTAAPARAADRPGAGSRG